MTGIDYPKITVGKHADLTVRWSLAAQNHLRRLGADPAKIITLMQGRLRGADGTEVVNDQAVANTVKAFTAMVAENFMDMDRPWLVAMDKAPTPDYWEIVIEDYDAVAQAVIDAVKKWLEERRKRLAVVPPASELAS